MKYVLIVSLLSMLVLIGAESLVYAGPLTLPLPPGSPIGSPGSTCAEGQVLSGGDDAICMQTGGPNNSSCPPNTLDTPYGCQSQCFSNLGWNCPVCPLGSVRTTSGYCVNTGDPSACPPGFHYVPASGLCLRNP